MIPLFVQGDNIAEGWENALVALWENGIDMETQYDIDPNTGVKHPPSKDCMMMLHVKNAMAEPRLHICLEGGPGELAEYKLEVVDGIKDHWVKLLPEDTKWTYTYSDRVNNWGGKCNFASIVEDGPIDPDNPWTQLAYARKVNGEIKYELIDPVDQIEDCVNKLVEAPFTRRAVALTGFPPGDIHTHDLPCLRYIWVRGRYDEGCLKIDMHTHWRSNDAWGAALFNMFALTELQKDIVERVQAKFGQMYVDKTLDTDVCPKCGSQLAQQSIWLADETGYARHIICNKCCITPYKVKVGSYTHVADSFHIYGMRIEEFKNRFLTAIENKSKENRMWDLSDPMMQTIQREGEERALKMVESLDEKNGITDLAKKNMSM